MTETIEITKNEAGSETTPGAAQSVLSIILNVEPDDKLELLEDVLLALAVQDYKFLEILILCSPSQAVDVKAICENQHWQPTMSHVVIHCDPEVHKTRADRLNHGFHSSTGDFLSVLEISDLVYSHTFEKMLQALQKSHAPLLVGGTRTALRNSRTGYILHKSKVHRPAKRNSDLWYDHECVKHFVVDKKRASGHLATESSLEDFEIYFFLLNFTLHNEIDFSLASEFLFERRVPTELEHYSPPAHDENTAEKAARLEKAHSKVLDWKAQHFELMHNALNELRQLSLQSAIVHQPTKISLLTPLLRLFGK